MLNHRDKRNTDWGFSEACNHVYINAGVGGVRKGEEVFLSYYENGLESHSADQWLRSYGFIPENNEQHDTLYVYAAVVPGDPSFGAKYSQLSGNASSLFRLSMDHTFLPTKRLFSFLRYKFHASPHISEYVKATELDIPPLSPKNELEVLSYLSDHCARFLDGFTSSLQEVGGCTEKWARGPLGASRSGGTSLKDLELKTRSFAFTCFCLILVDSFATFFKRC